MAYNFRTTYKQDDDTYIEDAGYMRVVAKGDADFDTVNSKFVTILQNNQTATFDADRDTWVVAEGNQILPIYNITKVMDLKKKLEEVDAKSMRSLRAILSEQGTEEDRSKLSALETESQQLRAEIRSLS